MLPKPISEPPGKGTPADGEERDDEERDDIVDDVADALTLNQEVPWERCEKLATPAERRALDNLRTLAGAVTGVETSAAAVAAPRGRAVVRQAAQALVAISAVEVAATLMLLPWAWGDYQREHGEVAVFHVTKLLGHAASAGLLLFAGRGDPRTWLLGVYWLLKATQPQMHMLPAVIADIPPPEHYSAFIQDVPASVRLFLYLYVPSFLFAPAFLWMFARECPRVHRRSRLDDLARRMVPVSVAVGFAIWVGVGVTLQLAQWGYATASVPVVLDGSLVALDLLTLAAVAVVMLRAHTAPAEEVRRVVVFSAGFLMLAGLSAAYNVAEAFRPGYWVANYQWSPAVLGIEVMRFPGMVLLWYSVLAVRVPHVREVVRAGYERLLARSGLLPAAAAVPALGLAWLVASRLERPVGALLADPLAQALFAAAGVLLLAALGREPLLRRLDAWTHPEAADQKQGLAAATAALSRAGSVRTVRRAVTRAAKHGCGSPAVLAAALDLDTPAATFRAPGAAPLARTSAIVHMLESAAGPLRVHPADPSSFFKLLPEDEAAWVVETAADAVVPVPGPGGELLGVLAVGRRFDDRLVRPVDLPFLEGLAAGAGLALGRLSLMGPAGGSSVEASEASPAEECPACGCVVEAGGAVGCGCGSAYAEAEVPKLLAGKFQVTRRLGAGGMGAAYLARDLRLERNVAVKTLTDLSAPTGLKPEAWAMADLSHPAVAQVYAIESWRGRPFLVAEYLAGGTLADRLTRGPLSEREAVSVAGTLASALAALHEAGYLHGDVKPGNIGFTAGGSPKLLDFGLAREANDPGLLGGTLRYASPEVLAGRPAEEADDVWSLAVVLYEMATGEHPFARPGDGPGDVTRRIRRRRVGPAGGRPGPGPQSPAAAFAAALLSAPQPLRPATAAAFAAALRGAEAEDL